MGLKRRGSKESNGSGDKKNIVCENLKEGQEYEARLVYVADLGLHEAYGNDEKPDVQKIALGYEVLGETVKIDDEEHPRLLWDRPFNIYWQLTPQGNELVQYKLFDPTATEGMVADWEKVLGTPVNLTVKHVSDKKDPTIKYDNISSVQPIPKKYQKDVAKSLITPCVGDADDQENDATKSLYGLTKWFFDRRRVEGVSVEPASNPPTFEDDDLPF